MKRSYLAILVLAAAVTGLFVAASSAAAAPTDPFVYKSTFGEKEDHSWRWGEMVVNHATGNVIVLGSDGGLYQFDAEGNPVDFPALGSNVIFGTSTYIGGLYIDNSGGPNQGNFYTFSGVQPFSTYWAFKADGSPFGTGAGGPGKYIPWEEAYGEGFNHIPIGFAVAPDGNIWLGEDNGVIKELTPTGELTGASADLGRQTYALRFDETGNLYVGTAPQARYDVDAGFADRGGVGLKGVSYAINPATQELYQVDQTPGRIFLLAVAPVDPPAEPEPYEVLSSDFGLNFASDFALYPPHRIGFDGSGQTMYLTEEWRIRIFHREPVSAPSNLTPGTATQIRTGSTTFRGSLFNGGGTTSYYFEYGTDTSYGKTTPVTTAPFNYYATNAAAQVSGLEPNVEYHVRLVATNSAGTTYGPDGVFRTYRGALGGGIDSCPNALARKQTVAQRLPDCRAYELASAPDTDGYDVESYLSPGQRPFPSFPLATDRLLYATHSGAVPGPWHATNNGPDPYVATRTGSGWVTDYKGLPSDINPAAGSFSSVLGEADPTLSTLAFAGPNLCSPCFTSGLETGIPLRLADGKLIQGMDGSLAAGVPADAMPEGMVAKFFSGDGKHLVFASKYAFEPGANDNGSDLTVYDRDLAAGTTQIVSRDESGAVLTGDVSELDISADGSRIVTATAVSTDSAGNEIVHPYMHLGSAPDSVDLAPGTVAGVRFAGMTADGSKAFFTTTDQLIAGDTDTSADLYEAAVDGSGALNLAVITAPDSDACDPVSNSDGAHWNTTGSSANCDAVAISGGGGVASDSGAIYFLSPELLGGAGGTSNQPNLYLAEPGGSPTFVATLEPDNPLVLDSVKANAARRTGDFQTTPTGTFATFVSSLDLTAVDTHELRSVYRFGADSGELECASCDRTGSAEPGVFAAADLPPNGLGLLADGRLFFTTAAQLVINDANAKKDVYQWSNGEPVLISAGSGSFDSALLGASADGIDVFFFTQDNLAPEEDRNGAQMRIYDARKEGGYFKLPASVPCQASDECHGPSSPQPQPADIKSSGPTTRGNVRACPKHKVKKQGRCVKKKKKSHRQKKRSTGGKHA